MLRAGPSIPAPRRCCSLTALGALILFLFALRPLKARETRASLSPGCRGLSGKALGSRRVLGLATSLEPAAEQGLWGPQTTGSRAPNGLHRASCLLQGTLVPTPELLVMPRLLSTSSLDVMKNTGAPSTSPGRWLPPDRIFPYKSARKQGGS